MITIFYEMCGGPFPSLGGPWATAQPAHSYRQLGIYGTGVKGRNR